MTDPSDRRQVWQERWGHRRAEEFGWHLDEPPPQLVQMLERGGLPPGAALDIACGDGVATRFLAGSFSPSIGFDIAPGAAAKARARTDADRFPAFFLVADATAAWPFRDGSFKFAFDRGGLANLPSEAWGRYFEEAGRVIALGGILQILVSRPVRRGSPSLPHRILVRLRSLARPWRPAPEAMLEARLRQLAGPAFEVLTAERFLFVTRRGDRRQFTHVVFHRQRPAGRRVRPVRDSSTPSKVSRRPQRWS